MALTYYKSDFKNITGLGNNKHAECPVCGSTDNVSIDIGKGLVHCFTPGCTCSGTYIDEDRPAEGEPAAGETKHHKHQKMKQNDTEGLTPNSSLLTPHYPKSAADVPVYPSDFKGVDERLMNNLYDLTETEGEKGQCAALVRSYLESIHISPDTAQHFGLKAYPFNYEDKATGQKTTEGRSLHHSLCYPTRLLGRCVNLKSRAVDVKAFRNEKANKQLPGVPFNIDHLDRYMNCFDVESGDPSVADIIDACTRNLKLFHPDFLIVDNYARLRRDNVDDQNETEFIRNLLVALQNWGLRNRVWVIVVAHPRKPQDSASAETADAAAVAGSAHWHNLADLGITVKRIIRDDGLDYKEIIVWKVRDQRICTLGTIFLLRQPCGRYEVRGSRQEVETEWMGRVRYRDRGIWISEELGVRS